MSFSLTDGKGFHITFKNGWTVSVQWGPGNYCDNHDLSLMDWLKSKDYGRVKSSTVEVAYWGPDHNMVRFDDGDTVQGYVSADDVLALMNKVAAL